MFLITRSNSTTYKLFWSPLIPKLLNGFQCVKTTKLNVCSSRKCLVSLKNVDLSHSLLLSNHASLKLKRVILPCQLNNEISKHLNPFIFLSIRCQATMVRILNVAEKNDAAKNLAEILSRGGYTRKEGFSRFNKLYEFDMMLHGSRVHMVMTSVSGHLLNQSFTGNYKKWYGCNPLALFDAPVIKICQENMLPIKQTLEREARLASRLIIWTDCDREGENIGFEIINVCKAINPNLQVQRAKFSEITFQSVNRAIDNLGIPDENQNNAVEVRSELDLRIGAAFTRFQTLRLQKVFPGILSETLISYGSCQFPTLGFVVERYKAIEEFIPEQFWKIKVSHEYENCVVDFHWSRVRLFDQIACQVLHDRCLEAPQATVKSVKSKLKSKWRPQPLDTIEFEKLASRKLRLNAKEAMRVAEKLYTSGYISYPRTETNIFPKELNLVPLVQMQTEDPNWGGFANRVLANGPTPRQGRKSDQAHPPIHPTKYAGNLSDNEKKVYEFIVRHFLACCDKDAKGTETIVEIDIAGEQFVASGLIILERNYLDVYPYDKWSDKEMPQYEQGQVFEPSAIELVDSQTSPPSLLTEADLIALMEKHGIGTDATHAEHIETIKSRMYVGLQNIYFVPGELGMGLVEGYDSMGFEMSKPNLRAELEADLKRICEGKKDPQVVLKEQVDKYRNVFREAMRQASKIDVALGRFLNQEPQTPAEDIAIPDVPEAAASVMKCHSCGADVTVKSKRDNKGLFLSCQSYPECRAVLWLPETVKKLEVLDQTCSECRGAPHMLKFTFSPRAYSPILPMEYTSCVGGCDSLLMETLDIRPMNFTPQRLNERRDNTQLSNQTSTRDSGYSSTNSTRIILSNRTNTTNNPADQQVIAARNSWFPSQQNPSHLSGSQQVNNFNATRAQSNRGRGAATPNPLPRPQPKRGGFNSAPTNNFSTPRFSNSGGNNRFGSNWDDGEKGNAIVCNCDEDAIKLTVRKEGPNTGRLFYKCSKPQGQSCNFFLWADDDDDGGPTSNANNSNNSATNNRNWQSNTSSWNNNSDQGPYGNSFGGGSFGGDEEFEDDTERVTCNCGIDAKRLTTLKEGANKGREFYVCPKTREEQCGFFQWVDELQMGGGSRGGNSWRGAPSFRGQTWTSRGRGAARGGTKRKAPGSETPAKRKCGACGEEGHDRRTCPHS